MNARTLGLVLAVLLLAAPALAQKIFVDYDRSVDPSKYKTFAWGPTPGPSLKEDSPLMHSRIKNAIEYHLTEGGLVEDPENPDIYVTYYTDVEDEVRLDTTHMGYGYGPGWGWSPYWGGGMGMGSSTTTMTKYQRGTLIIALWDAKTKKLVWRASAQAVVKQNPQKAAKQIDSVINKIVKKWQKMYAKDQKRKAKGQS